MLGLRDMRWALLVGVAAPALAGCLGSGSGGSSTFVSDGSEGSNNYGIGLVRAPAVHAVGGDGSGVIVAVIDTGIDTQHFDLAANISPDSFDVIHDSLEISDGTGHGTTVAGVIAAERNGVGVHGVAYNATILAIDAEDEREGPGFTIGHLVESINYAVSKNADVINMSLGGPGADVFVLREAQFAATRAGVILVSAAGNEGVGDVRNSPGPIGDGLNPSYPARHASDTQMNGLALAVGSVDQFRNLSSFSNQCGVSKNFCLVAPGEAIVTTAAGGGYTRVNGTSFAAPHVAGAIALLIDLFPLVPRRDLVEILLRAADDLGEEGVDDVFGHGMLNIEAALAPMGEVVVPAGPNAAGRSALSETRVNLGAAFGDALAGNVLLANAIALDDYDRAYPVDLTSGVSSADRSFHLQNRLAPSDTRINVIPGPGMTLRAAMKQSVDDTDWWLTFAEQSAASLDWMSLTGEVAAGTDWNLGLGISAGGQLDRGFLAVASGGLFMDGDGLDVPHYALLGSGDGARLDQSLSEATTLSLGWFESSSVEAGSGDPSWGDGTIVQATLDHAFADGGGLKLDLARLEEADTYLGSRSGGAFELGAGTISDFITVSGGFPVTATVDVIGSVATATTEVSDGGLLSDWGTVRTTAFSGGVVARDIFDAGDRIGLLASQPLRVAQANVTLTVPTGVTLDEGIISDQQRIDLSPSGREINVQLAYDRHLWEGAKVSSWLMMRTEPGHDARAPNDYGVGLVFKMAY